VKEVGLSTDTIKLPRAQAPAAADELWPPEVDLILSAMEAARAEAPVDAHAEAHGASGDGPADPHAELAAPERRHGGRTPYRVRAALRLFSDAPGQAPWSLYTRDVDRRGLGFITPHRLPLGYGGTIELHAPSGRKVTLPCTLFRCRQTVQGWYEGALSFHRDQDDFDV
jgi:hypothetical protein